MGHQFPSEFYTKTNWKNEPDTSTPLGQANLNHIEQGIKTADERIYNLDGRIGVYEDYETEISAQVQQAKDYSESAEDSATDSANSATQSSGYASDCNTLANVCSQQYLNAKAEAQNSEAWAVGTRNGTPVPRTDETYENNSKYYAEQAQQIVDDSTITFTQASTRANINSGETISTIMGKIKKFFTDLKTVAFTGNASDVSYTNTTSELSATTVQGAIDEINNVKITVVTFSDLSKYGIATSGTEQINATLEEICKKVPYFCEVKIQWTGNQTLSDSSYRFGTLGAQMPELYGSLYIHKNGNTYPCVIEFIPFNSGNHYTRNYDYVNSANHLSSWANINVGNAIANDELNNQKSSRAYSVGQYMVQDGHLKKATSAIASGESLTANNTITTTVGQELTEINTYIDGYHIQLTSENLDNVITPGKYTQNSSANCTVARNYPVANAGTLVVETVGSNIVIQTYHPSAAIDYIVSFRRRRYNGTWEAWGSDDWISLLYVPANITIPTTGYSITLNYNVFARCRAKRIITYYVNELPQNGFASNGTYASYNFMLNATSYFVLRWDNISTSPNACKLYYYINGTATQIATGNTAPIIQGILGNRGNYVTYQLSQ